MRNAYSITNGEVGLNHPPTHKDDLLVPTLHNILGELNPTEFCVVIRALLEMRADQHYEGREFDRKYDTWSISTDDVGWFTFTTEHDATD